MGRGLPWGGMNCVQFWAKNRLEDTKRGNCWEPMSLPHVKLLGGVL